jgi:hypothetical protein
MTPAGARRQPWGHADRTLRHWLHGICGKRRNHSRARIGHQQEVSESAAIISRLTGAVLY